MGFFQDLMGDTAADAAGAARDQMFQDRGNSLRYLDEYGQRAENAIRSGYGSGRGALQGGYDSAINFLDQTYTPARNDLISGSNKAQGYLDQGRTDALNSYGSLDQLASKYGGATTLALNALGVNGQQGTQAARDAFQYSPAYNFNLDQGLEAINRRRNAGGMLNSGNADQDAQKFGAGLASNEYNTWLNNLMGFQGGELSATSTAATGRAGVNQNYGNTSANLANQTGQNLSNMAINRGNTLANLATQYGANMANNYTGEAGNLANINWNRGTTGADTYYKYSQPVANTFMQQAAAQGAGSANLANLGINVAKMVARGVGGTAGLGSGMGMQTGGNVASIPNAAYSGGAPWESTGMGLW